MHPLPNAVMTVIVGILALYWLFAFLSGAGMDDLDIGIDVDADVDVPDADSFADIDVDTEPDAAEGEASEKETGAFMKFLQFMNVGKVPFMLIFSTLKLFMWVGSLITTSFINVTTWGAWSLFILLPIGFVALFFTKAATNPMVRIFKELGYKGENPIDFVGRSGKMLSTIRGEKIGTAEVWVDNNPMKLNVISHNGDEIKYGEYIIVEDESEDNKTFYVSKEISIRNF